MPLINNEEYAYSQATFTIGGRIEDRVKSIKYSDETKMKNNYGAGQRPISRSRGMYEPTASIELYQSAVEEIQLAAPDGDLAQIPQFDITVTFVSTVGMAPVKHKIRGCQFMGNSRDLAQSEDGITVNLNLIVADILWK